jgi:hypothetical protein
MTCRLLTMVTLALSPVFLVPSELTRGAVVEARQDAAGAVIEDSRPVAKAMALLSRQLDWIITYEDPVYVNAADLQVLDPRHAIPRPGRLQLPDSAVIKMAQQDPVAFLESVLGQEETSYGKVKRFKVLRSASMFHVVPERVLDAAGQWQAVVPVLDTTVSISHRATTLADFLELVVPELSAASGTKIITASMPQNARVPRGSVAPLMVPAQERRATARAILRDTLSTLDVPLKWVLMYDPSSATYYLSVVRAGAS